MYRWYTMPSMMEVYEVSAFALDDDTVLVLHRSILHVSGGTSIIILVR